MLRTPISWIISMAACFPRSTAEVPSPIRMESPAANTFVPNTSRPFIRSWLSGIRPVQILMASMPSMTFSVPGTGVKLRHSAITAPQMPSLVLLGIALTRVCDRMTGMPSLLTLLACTGKPPS
ncbi:MAG: hypothetical protein BWY89_01510 [Bacteroidetes bacterium ADurb.BinA012]|nr:MAG: hypothetical protein BWY89_01510 [Bacteroidetes bacterium ADurb.BinA012]